ncbi:MAG: hypothetical protein F2843_00990 [Actinobacteria bacterium]|uniref:Unannotated protein n=1 Tax=freshwater metagenome TaxID=449393 RepID=A0A6J7IPE9_9ZZZZ|nr:hypothetical protein [Actinomycetota bacterium]
MKAKVLLLACALSLSLTPADAATTAKATPKASVKATVKAAPKSTSTKAPVAKKPVVKKPVVKKPVVKKPVVKKRVVRKKKNVKVTPLPKPVWPPSVKLGWVVDNAASPDIYVRKKVPSPDLVASDLNKKYFFLTDYQKQACTKFACSAIQVVSTYGCGWWEITSTVYGPISESSTVLSVKGTLTSVTGATNPKQEALVYLISGELLNGSKLYQVKPIKVVCTRGTPPENRNTQSYQSIDTPTPSPSVTKS